VELTQTADFESADDIALADKMNRGRQQIIDELKKRIIGQSDVIELVLLTLFVGGNSLIVGVPGLAKTLLIATLARVLDLKFNRIQFTPDLMPSDITGTDIINEDAATGRRQMVFAPGPIFANIVLADEINRTPPKTQAALLEAMQERQVTIGENTGEVVQTSMLATHLRTIRNEEITIPNSVVLGSFVTNFSLLAKEQGVVLHTSVTIGYDAPWRTIHKLLIDAALKTKHILHEPAPFVLQADLQDSYVKYEINAYTDHPLLMPYIYSDLHANIQDSFYEEGVEIMSPIFHALRDGNRTAIPDTYLPRDYKPKSFRFNEVETKTDRGGPHS
jgi:hypothetical protein